MARLERTRGAAARPIWLELVPSAALLFPIILSAQGLGSIAGVVTDSSGIPILGAHVTVDSVPFNAFTDENGRFLLGSLPPGVRRLSARRLGFQPAAVDVQVSGVERATVSLRMNALPISLAPVVVRPDRMRYTGRLAGYYERLEKKGSGVFIT